METNELIIKSKQKKALAEQNLAKERIRIRKKDAHNKIQLGGLVVKAKIDKYSKAVILGALIHAMENINNDPDYESFYKNIGDLHFINPED